ncbi:MAG: Shikimate kinase [Akkermansiaceae bacterium]|nr:Shikimate kinase [Akkermansiaceae bacterium]
MLHPEPLPKNIVLIGFMGCGKTTIGKKLQHMLGYPMIDIDHLIEEKAGMPVNAIFSAFGESQFRELETAVLHELTAPDAPRRIISTGGGIVSRRQNRRLLHQLGFVVWLQAPVDAILERTARNKDRPLLQTENPRQRIEALLDLRTPWYQETAHLAVDTYGLDAEEVATGILESARYHFAAKP